MCRLTGYSRQQLTNLRLGYKQQGRTGDKVYISPPALVQGKDWQRYGRAVLYADHTQRLLAERREPTPTLPLS
jgi:hypothetical protein